MIIIKVLELFSGTQSISKSFRKNKHECFTVENDSFFDDITSLNMDIFELTPEIILEKFGQPDVIWASPPCTKFSVASIGKHWVKGTNNPKTKEAEEAIELLKHVIWLIKELNPKLFFIENPRGKMRKLDIMQEFNRHTITYCQYGDTRMKPTDIWTNHPNPKFKPTCKNGDPCHVSAPRGSRTGTQGLKNAMERSRIPEGFCDYVVEISEDQILEVWDDMTVEELLIKKTELENREPIWDQWKDEFTRQEIKQITKLIKDRL